MAQRVPTETLARILIVDDDLMQAEMLRGILALEGFDVHCLDSPKDALAEVPRLKPDVLISDYRMPEMSGLDLFLAVHAVAPEVIFIITTAFGTLETAVNAMRAGVHDFVTKPVDTDELTLKLKKALRVRVLEEENADLRRAVDALRERISIVGESPGIRKVLSVIEQVAPSLATVLIHGESGTGKELVARGLHLSSARHTKPYVKINCASVPDNLLEDELFGHRRGAFTGAVADRMGKFEMADGGTIFLDEIGDLPLHLQPKLLRVLQEREIEPVGSNEVRELDVRVIAATHKDLAAMVKEGTFREDLFYRLSVIPIRLPALRERTEDIALLAEHFLRKYCERNGKRVAGFTARAKERLETYSWPGNVRELENCIERAVVLSRGSPIDVAELLLEGPRKDGVVSSVVDLLFDSELGVEELERQIILMALERCGDNLSRAARSLGLTRRALQYRVEKIRGRVDP